MLGMQKQNGITSNNYIAKFFAEYRWSITYVHSIET